MSNWVSNGVGYGWDIWLLGLKQWSRIQFISGAFEHSVLRVCLGKCGVLHYSTNHKFTIYNNYMQC